MFLKRCECPGVSMTDLFIGIIVTIFSRQLKVVDYGDVYTRKQFEIKRSKTLALIKPDAYNHIGKILDAIYKNGFSINRMRMLKMSLELAEIFYAEHKGKDFFEPLTKRMSEDVIVALELVADDAVAKWRKLIGPTDSEKARKEAPGTIRALYGTDGRKNAVHGSDSSVSAIREIDIVFGDNVPSTAPFK